MGFLDKAKKLAEQAQTKLDEVQKQVNTSGGGTSSSSGAPITEYDKHGRPIPREQSATPPTVIR
jgi:Fe-S oxidoreductase